MSDQIETPETEEQITDSADPKTSVKDLEEEGEVAADYLEELLDIFDLMATSTSMSGREEPIWRSLQTSRATSDWFRTQTQ